MTRITEQPSNHKNLEKKNVEELTILINQEDKTVPLAVEKALPAIQDLIKTIVAKLHEGGRMFYLGAGSGGRLSVLDVIELPTTFGIEPGRVKAILAGGLENLVLALEDKEDDELEGWKALEAQEISSKDIVVGISASGTTPFVLAALKKCRENKVVTGCIVNNPSSPIADQADYPVEVITGPEFITGSTRMKSGTAQKMIFDMISTTVMIQLGRVFDNKMVHVKLINQKITDRAVHILMELSGLRDYEKAKALLLQKGSVDKAIQYLNDTNHH